MEATSSRRLRAGVRILSLLAVPLNGLIICALGKGPKRHAELFRELGNPAETTLRGHLAKLEELGAVRREMRSGASYFVQNELTEKGRDLLIATRALERWLDMAPQGPIQLGSVQSKGAVKALSGAWDASIFRALAATPLSLTQLDRLISAFSYPALERRLAAMRAAGLVEGARNRDGTAYSVTPWARRGIGPVIAAVRFERFHLEETPPPRPIDIEATFLLATPLCPLPRDADGACDLVAVTGRGEDGNGAHPRVGVHVAVDRGKVVSCVARLSERPTNWALGSVLAWLEALVCEQEDLRIGGNRPLARSLVQGLHGFLFENA